MFQPIIIAIPKNNHQAAIQALESNQQCLLEELLRVIEELYSRIEELEEMYDNA